MIGIFDSGLGGLLVAREILKKTRAPIVYFGDTAHLPYGTKSKKAILNFSKKNIEFLLKKRAKIIVIACNTSSAIAGDFLKKKYNVPIFDVIEPVIEKIPQLNGAKKIGVIGTPATIKSGVYEKRIKRLFKDGIKVYSKGCPLLVPLIEEGWINHKVTKEILKEYLYPFKKKKIDVLILGCTHYPVLKSLIVKELGSNVKILDSSKEIAKKISSFLGKRNIKTKKEGDLKIFLSDEGYNFKKMIKIFKYVKKVKVKIIKPL